MGGVKVSKGLTPNQMSKVKVVAEGVKLYGINPGQLTSINRSWHDYESSFPSEWSN